MLAAKGPPGLQCRAPVASRRVSGCNVRASKLHCRAQASSSSSSSGSWDAAATPQSDAAQTACSTSGSSGVGCSSSTNSTPSSSSTSSQWQGSRKLFGSALLGSAAVVVPGLGGTGVFGSGGSSGSGGGGWGWNPWGSSSGSGGVGPSHGGPLFDLAAAEDGSKPKKKKKKSKKKKEEQQAAEEDDGMDITESEEEPMNVEEENRAALLITSDTQLEEMVADAGAEKDGQRHGTHRCVEVGGCWFSVLFIYTGGGGWGGESGAFNSDGVHMHSRQVHLYQVGQRHSTHNCVEVGGCCSGGWAGLGWAGLGWEVAVHRCRCILRGGGVRCLQWSWVHSFAHRCVQVGGSMLLYLHSCIMPGGGAMLAVSSSVVLKV